MLFSKLINAGTLHQPFPVANRARITNIIGLITTLISALYSLNYLLILDEPLVALINFCFTAAYFVTLLFIREQAFRAGKVWFFGVLMFHLWVCTNIYVTNDTGFHLYYFLVPTGAFLIFELGEKREKSVLTVIALILFFTVKIPITLLH